MGAVSYTVDLVTQAQNPICWVASCAMVKGWATNTSVGVGDLIGFDPSNSSIPNPANDWNACTSIMSSWGFNMQSVATLSASGTMTAADILTAMQQLGPIVLLHHCVGFPYGPRWNALTSGAHAVVLTSVDSDASQLTFNNPWGDLNQSAGTDQILLIMNRDSADKGLIFGAYPRSS